MSLRTRAPRRWSFYVVLLGANVVTAPGLWLFTLNSPGPLALSRTSTAGSCPVRRARRMADLLRADFQNLYLDNCCRPTAFNPHRLATFEDFCRRYAGAGLRCPTVSTR